MRGVYAKDNVGVLARDQRNPPSGAMIDRCAANSAHQAPAGTWMEGASKLCASTFKISAGPGRDRAAIANALRRARAPLPDRKDGVNFENKYISIYPEEGAPGGLVCARGAKGPSRNCYAAIPVEILFMPPDTSVSRMKLFLWTTFARRD